MLLWLLSYLNLAHNVVNTNCPLEKMVVQQPSKSPLHEENESLQMQPEEVGATIIQPSPILNETIVIERRPNLIIGEELYPEEESIGSTFFWLPEKGNSNVPLMGKEVHAKWARNLIDIFVIGFSKTGTTTIMQWLTTPESFMANFEQCKYVNMYGRKIKFYQHNILKRAKRKHPDTIVGLKCPISMRTGVFEYTYSKLLPKIDLIIGLRHPVRWFESYYNYRLINTKNQKYIPLAHELIGSKCNLGMNWWICTDAAKFAIAMAKMGKTKMNQDEIDLLLDMAGSDKQRRGFEIYLNHPERVKLQNRVFVYDIEQLSDKNKTRLEIFGSDLARFVGLKGELPPPPVYNKNAVTENVEDKKHRRLEEEDDSIADNNEILGSLKENEELELTQRNKGLRINICDQQFEDLREILIADAKKTTEWLTDYFLADGHNVFVSDMDFLLEIIKSWNEDPC